MEEERTVSAAAEEIAAAEATADPATKPAVSAEPVPEKKSGKAKAVLRAHFTAPRIAYMALFTALAYVITFLEFPIFPATPYLKLDFANVFFMFEGFIFGPVEAIVSIGIKELLCFADSGTAGVGEVANFIMSTAYIIVPSVAYRFLKGRKWVTLFLAIACVVQIGSSLLVNRYINFPFFGIADQFAKVWYFVLAFNAIKSVGISVVVFLLYKPLSRFIKMTSDKFEKRMAQAKGKKKSKKAE